MTVTWPWLVPVLVATVAVSGAWGWRRVRRGQRAPVAAAHTGRLAALPAYRARRRHHRRWLGVMAMATAALAVSTSALAARPLRQTSVPPVLDNRDIVLCLDVSGSMVEYNRSILERFAELLAGFDGERVGMTIFNSSAVPAFPLTTDHRYLTDEFERFQATFAARGVDALTGTLEGDGTSLVPDGIASCALSLPAEPDGRSRAMVVATDNIVEGPSLLTMAQVSALLVQRDIRAYVLVPVFDFERDRPRIREMRELARLTGGEFFGTENPTAVGSIIDQVDALERARLDVEPTAVRYADSSVWVVAAAAALAALVLAAGRVRG